MVTDIDTEISKNRPEIISLRYLTPLSHWKRHSITHVRKLANEKLINRVEHSETCRSNEGHFNHHLIV